MQRIRILAVEDGACLGVNDDAGIARSGSGRGRCRRADSGERQSKADENLSNKLAGMGRGYGGNLALFCSSLALMFSVVERCLHTLRIEAA
jgi:hypothetical protein